MISVDEALERILAAATVQAGTERIALTAALQRVLAEDITAAMHSPPWDNSAMDGYAVRAADIAAGTTLAVSQRITAGSAPQVLAANTAARIFTGAPIPAGSDTVVIQEDVDAADNAVTFREACKPGANVRRQGHDVAKGTRVLAAGHRIRPADIGLLAALGVADVAVRKPLRVAVIATGDELTPVGEPLSAGSLYDSNGPMLTALLMQLGMQVIDGGRLHDDLASTRTRLRELAAQADVLLTTGGVSVGEEDHVKAAIEAEGELKLWKVRVKPGKPLGFGRVANTPWFGLPGNPVSAFVTFQLFVRPWLLKSQGASELYLKRLTLTAGFDWPKAGTRQEYLRGRIENDVVQLHLRQGSDALSGISWADCLVEIPVGQVLRQGDQVAALLV